MKKQSRTSPIFRSRSSRTTAQDLANHKSHLVGGSPYKIPNYLRDDKCPFGKIKNVVWNPSLPEKEQGPPTTLEVPGKFNWMDGDNLVNFEKNKRKAPKKWKYLKKEITYTLNSDGFRTLEWDQVDWKNSIVLLGCSCTYGVGVSDEETIAYHLEKLSGRQVINLGIPGGSNSLILQNAVSILENFTAPYAVAHIWSTSNRFKFFGKTDTYNTGPWDGANTQRSGASDVVDINKLWRYTYADPYHELALAYYDGKIGKYIWDGKSKYSSISFFPDTAYYTNSEKHFVIDSSARDLMHPGEGCFKQVAAYLHRKFT